MMACRRIKKARPPKGTGFLFVVQLLLYYLPYIETSSRGISLGRANAYQR